MANDLRDFGAAAQAARERKDLVKTRVLAVDDEPSILELLKTALNALGSYEVTTALSAEDAIQAMERAKKPFDCLLMDIQMPQVNGIVFTRELRKTQDYARTPIIMLTAMSERSYIDDAFAAGATDYVTKPFDLLELRSRLGTATMLVREQGRARESIAVAKKLKDELDTNLQFALSDPITIDGVENVLGYAEFENYIIQLSQGKLFNAVATAVKILDAKDLYSAMTSSEFRQLIEDVARAMSKLTRKNGNMICYRGHGTFVTVSHRRATALGPDDELQLNQVLATLRARHQKARNATLVVGEPASMRSLTKYGALHALG
ncbi:MAG: response regulator, partial [Rhodobacteraceae bacterium]